MLSDFLFKSMSFFCTKKEAFYFSLGFYWCIMTYIMAYCKYLQKRYLLKAEILVLTTLVIIMIL